MEYYKLRIDLLDGKEELYREMETRYFSSYVRSEEIVADDDGLANPHYHYYIETTSTASAIRQFIRMNFGSGNGVYSLKKLDEEKPIQYLAYLVKQDTNSVWFKMPLNLKDEAVSYDKQVKESMKNRKARKEPTWKKIEVYLVKKWGSVPQNKEQLIRSVLEYYEEEGLMIRTFLLINVIETLLITNSPKYKDRYVQRLLEKVE